MTCEIARQQLSLYLYGELDFHGEEMIEQHLDGCAECQTALARERALHRAVDAGQSLPSPELLQACRRQLRAALPVAAPEPRGWRERLQALVFSWNWQTALRPAGALALVALGFFGARVWDAQQREASPVLRVRNLNPGPEGNVQLVLDEVRQRTIQGALDDHGIRQMLLAAAADPTDAGLRARTMDVLKTQCAQSEVRRALLRALRQDPNDGVRLKALEALKPFAQERETRDALADVLLRDTNPGVRTIAIDLLVEELDPDLIGTLQGLIVRETNPYIRQRTIHALRQANASVETF